MVLHNLIMCLIFDLIRMRPVPPVLPLKASKWKVVMFDKKISQLFPLPYFPPSPATIISFQAAPPAQNKRHIIQSIMGRGAYVDKSYSYACAGTPASSLSSLCQGVTDT